MSSRITKRYASAFLEFSERNAITEMTITDVKHFLEACRENKEFLVFLKSPVVKVSKKKKVLHAAFENVFCRETLNFIDLIADNQRENLLFEIFTEFLELYKQKNGIVTAELTTAVPVDRELAEKIKEFVRKVSSSKSVELVNKTDPSIIGGFKIKFHDKLLDATIVHELKEIRKRMIK
ncbi:MAG TPA: ATP synthase F1 subunit delta [Bacteroidia bacterium]|nr:ATP synthase F1 subunit delta [Sphingobacteriales bacterium]HPD66055.1 ATP synthase F1 subunit delta [Bacteroidia bacterium]HRS59645.1 ATP synthase F1 subunit delta [Bacteroidia bacterium]HRU68188.1 ATP synthase F1 subunit delta [Bacteroidia bacterium]